ncbi:MAG: ABC transporter substrate-binding protein [Synergistota bacterium]|nr:ABC transporter substrate-binding protein [Synergistota bacterium]
MAILKKALIMMVLVLLVGGVALAQDTIKIGFFAPLTGPAAADGASALNSAQLAIEYINEQGGVLGKKLELVVYDDGLKPSEAVAVARKLIEKDKVVGVVSGSYSGPTRAAAPVFQEAKIPMVAAYAVHPEITRAGEYIFRNGFLGEIEGAAAAEVVGKKLNAKTVYLLTVDIDYGRALSAGFRSRAEKIGLKIIGEKFFPMGEKDFTPYLTEIKAANPDAIFISGYYFHAPAVVQARNLGYTGYIVGEEGFDSPKFIEIAGKAAEGVVIVTNFDRDDPRPLVKWFINKYKEKYKIDPDMVGASSFDAVFILVEGIKRAGSTEAAKIKDAIASLKDFDVLTGKIKRFTKIGEVVKAVQVQIVKDGTFRHYGVIDDPEIIKPPEE